MLWTLLVSTLLTFVAGGIVWLGRRVTKARRRMGRLIVVIASVLMLLPAGVASYLAVCLLGGSPAGATRTLAAGVTYERRVMRSPKAVVHIVQIDDLPRRAWRVTPPVKTAAGYRNVAVDAEAAVRELRADVMINANFSRHSPATALST